MFKIRKEVVKIGKITDSVKVRSGGLVPERLAFLQGVHDNGGDFGPLRLVRLPNGNYKLVGGNHRLQVLKNNGATETEAEVIVDTLSDLEQYRAAVEDNSGGSQPFTREDLAYQIRQLLKLKADTKQIVLSFPSIPSEYVMDALDNVRSAAKKAAAIRAADRVRAGEMTVKQAAVAEGAEEKSVRTQLVPIKERPTSSPLDVKNVNAAQGISFRAISKTFSDWYKDAEKEYYVAGKGKTEMIDVLKHQKALLRHALNVIKDKEERVAKL
jgi:ParB-like chromosome segregation protein Spo0J